MTAAQLKHAENVGALGQKSDCGERDRDKEGEIEAQRWARQQGRLISRQDGTPLSSGESNLDNLLRVIVANS